MTRPVRHWRFATLVFLAAGCPMWSRASAPGAATLSRLRVVAESHANRGTATALDVVFVYDRTAMAALPKTSPEWFADKAELEAGLARSIEVVPLQVPPATAMDVALPVTRAHAVAVYAYASYLAPSGQVRLELTTCRSALIRLAADRVEVSTPTWPKAAWLDSGGP